ncbi:MAG: hydrogenase maturation protease [candidate division KSB1 bacterium]|nr:hydrogenase maturation protease [candidate division KSB1 bacterium]MDZ7393536.1 hydrogenase maturation protease [candidate division KSB1 bacterium]MDZ7412387.1 hydrogenase maturation protease [candidate division KSB1 bacterium]
MGEPTHQVLVVGVGNLLMADEGVGVHGANALRSVPLPPHVRVMECGTNFMAIAPHVAGLGTLIIIDAVRTGSAPGSLHRFSYEEIERAPAGLRFAHQVNLISSLRLLRAADPSFSTARVVLLGVEPKAIEPSLELSDEVREAMPALIEAVRAEVALEH